MICASLLCGVVLALISAITTAVLGHGLLMAFLAYVLGGIAGTVFLLLAATLMQRLGYARLTTAES